MTSAPDPVARDAARIAGGSGIVFVGGVADRGLRWIVKWFLSGTLGPAGLGLYETAVNLAGALVAFSPLGLDTGIVFFASRYRRSAEQGRLKGTLILGLGLALGMGVLAALGLALVGAVGPWFTPQVRSALLRVAPVIALWTPLLFAVGSLRAVKDMRHSALAFQVFLPLTLLGGVLLAVGVLHLGVPGALGALGVATAVGLGLALLYAWGHYRTVFQDRDIIAIFEPGKVLGFSIPQSLTAAAFRLNMRMDILMLAWLGALPEVGLYTVAASLASIGAIPANAFTAMFNPFIAELVYAGELERLNGILKIVTRWLVIISLPVYIVLGLLPDAVLSVYDVAYQVSALPLVVLVIGQLVNTVCAPTMRLIPMSGHAMLNLVNGVVALALNAGLNWLLIPQYGALGAALATGITLALWSVWRVGEVWVMLRCFPFDLRTTSIIALGVGGAVAEGLLLRGFGLWTRLGAVGGLLLAYAVVVWLFGRTPADDVVLDKLKARLRRLRGA